MTASAEPDLEVRDDSLRAPDFFIVGHPKCGTTAMFEMLRRHPDIYMPDVKETWYFSCELARGRAAGRPQPARGEDELQRYLSLFADARPDQRIGEATPSYLRSHTAAERIARLQPQARIIALLREPASFLRSLHMQFVQTHVESEKDLRKALALETDRREGRNLPAHSAQARDLLYSQIVRYVEQLRRYHTVFPPEQVLVLIYEDFRSDNERIVREVLSFLEVSDTLALQEMTANPSVRVRSRRAHDFIHSVSVGRGPLSRATKETLKTFSSRRLRRGALRLARRKVLYAEPYPADAELMGELRHRFKDEVLALSDYIDRDLVSLWGYENVS